ncbi:uncharacterized protein LOC133099840 [Eubalaena glacialis]|uniref:uncharacterized protein LOC133099840 n=1 Tax=Eubalaena glacialis TaxID=27606 RepID=UPI002A5A5C6F|nr:uncharacterized protein LOC133099840 [Eubalaena glacialis]
MQPEKCGSQPGGAVAAPAAWQKFGGCCLRKQLLWAEAGADSMEGAPRWAQPSRDTSVRLANLSTGFSNRYLTLNMSKIQLYSTFSPQSSSLSQQQLYPSNCLASEFTVFQQLRRLRPPTGLASSEETHPQANSQDPEGANGARIPEPRAGQPPSRAGIGPHPGLQRVQGRPRGRRRKQAEWGWERRAVAERKGPGGHLAASPGTSELGAATPPAGQDSIPPRKGSDFLSGPPQGKINGLWHFPAFLIFNKTIVGGWPLCLLLGGSKPAHSRARGGASAIQQAGREQCLFVAGPRGSCGSATPRALPLENSESSRKPCSSSRSRPGKKAKHPF